MPTLKDLSGCRFGRLTVIKRDIDYISPRGQKNTKWICQCDCGNVVSVIGQGLKSSKTRSCGCLEKDHPNHRTHGETTTRLHREWALMKRRCGNPNSKEYEHYGGRGITVCDEWCASYESFRNWALSHGYTDELTIDRIDNTKGYSPENCRWATRIEQANNKTTNVFYEYNGKSQTIAEWAREYNLTYPTLYIRLRRHKMPIEIALFQNNQNYKKGEHL